MTDNARKQALPDEVNIYSSHAGLISVLQPWTHPDRIKEYEAVRYVRADSAALQPTSPMGDAEIFALANKHGIDIDMSEDPQVGCATDDFCRFVRAKLSRATPADQKVGE